MSKIFVSQSSFALAAGDAVAQGDSTPPPPGAVLPWQGRVGGVTSMAGMFFGNAGGFLPCPPAGVETYRRMRTCPTVAMGRVAATAAIKASPWSAQATRKGDTVPQEMLDLVNAVSEKLRWTYLNNAVFSIDYGFQSFEKVWGVGNPLGTGGELFNIVERLRPILPENTQPQALPTTGEFAGIKRGEVTLSRDKSLLVVHDAEGESLVGRSRLENLRETAWWPWRACVDRIGVLVNKVSGVCPVMEYPVGRARDASGAEVDTYDIAQAMLQQLSRGVGVALPNIMSKFAEDFVRKGLDPKAFKAWTLQFLETTPGHGDELIAICNYFETSIVRGLLVPERAVKEAIQAGSRADSETSSDLALMVQQETLQSIMEAFNSQVIDPLIFYNYGAQWVGRVRVVAQPLDDESAGLIREIVTKVLTNPSSPDLTMKVLKFGDMLDQLRLPRDAAAEAELDIPLDDIEKQMKAIDDKRKAGAGGSPGNLGGVVATQDTALQGQQIAAAAEIVAQVASGAIPRDSGIGLLMVGLGITNEAATAIMGSAGLKGVATTPNDGAKPEPKMIAAPAAPALPAPKTEPAAK